MGNAAIKNVGRPHSLGQRANAALGFGNHAACHNPSMGRTEQFTEVMFSTPQAEGCIISAKIIGMRNQQLVA